LEMIRRHHTRFTSAQLERAIRANAGEPDRYLRQAAARVILLMPEKEQKKIDKLLKSPLERTTWHLAKPGWEIAELLKEKKLPASVRLDVVRLVQKAMGDLCAASVRGKVWEGYTRNRATPAVPAAVLVRLRAGFPSDDETLDAELA